MTLFSDGLGAVSREGDALTFERRYDVPVARVWAALTTPERVAGWLADAEIDLRIGGVFRLSFPDHNYTMTGHIIELVPQQVIAWTWPHTEHPDSVVRWELFSEGSGCRLRLTQTRLGSPHLTSVAAGWHTHLEALPGAIEGFRTPLQAEREREIAKLYAGLSGDC